MSAELKKRPRPPINYKRQVHPILDVPLWAFEDWAWNAMDLGIEVTPIAGKDGMSRARRTIAAIQKQIIEQYGWPERG
ncbi:hypothetical protein [Synechococcus sp. UW105]|uniref:hypothetical protein n=1 Tax=Synechococcus sp. UW105 TaxID=337067 RepID=UPI000E0ED299|nr:hypothetical protein [Synechococcus sp. UW105]